MSNEACGYCGKDPAAGFAMIGDTRYCHGDDDPEPTCYMRSQRLLSPDAGKPFPNTIEPGLSPGGIVARTYSSEGAMLLEHLVGAGDTVKQLAEHAADVGVAQIRRTGFTFLAFYDGDTGELMAATVGVGDADAPGEGIRRGGYLG